MLTLSNDDFGRGQLVDVVAAAEQLVQRAISEPDYFGCAGGGGELIIDSITFLTTARVPFQYCLAMPVCPMPVCSLIAEL